MKFLTRKYAWLIALSLLVTLIVPYAYADTDADFLIRFLPTALTVEEGKVQAEGYFLNLNDDCTVKDLTDVHIKLYRDGTMLLEENADSLAAFSLEPLSASYQKLTLRGTAGLEAGTYACDSSYYADLTCAYALSGEKANHYAVGNIVTFGSYEQDNNLTNGTEPIEWMVLMVDGHKAMLLSRYCLEARAYNVDFVPMTWENCTLRAWMNDTFLIKAFNEEERARILPTQNQNPDNPYYSTVGGNPTTDKVFLLSLEEANDFFPEKAMRLAYSTEYAKAEGVHVHAESGTSWWWLRTPGNRQIDVCGVSTNGTISGYGSRDVYRPSGAVRPVIWVAFGD